METIENKVNKAYEDNKAIIEIARKAEEAHAKYAKVIEQVSRQEKTKKRDVLLYLLSGRPTSMLIALQKFGVGSYRDVIYDLRQEGWKISHYDGESKNNYGTATFHYHYMSDFPIEYIKQRTENPY